MARARARPGFRAAGARPDSRQSRPGTPPARRREHRRFAGTRSSRPPLGPAGHHHATLSRFDVQPRLQYGSPVSRIRWVMLVYRLPRTPSTPRIALWRKLRRLGVAQVVDGVVALPASPDAREQLEWLAEDVVQAGGEASIWLSEPATPAQHPALVRSL